MIGIILSWTAYFSPPKISSPIIIGVEGGGLGHLEEVADVRVGVDDGADAVDEAHDLLGGVVGGRGLAAKDGDAGHHLGPLLGGGRLDGVVAVDERQDVEVLALVLVDTLDLHVVQRVRRQIHAHQRLRAPHAPLTFFPK